ncbi:MAG: DNA mismatch repair endonuclease MutL [Erysipelotrichaceae bacterium]|nr:DNA mismatch repair endonuclease MutL [Erysipelotrichaceae bacterium]
MGIIQRMSPHLANMIAAGEVVERPMSVVKELVENAIDAKCSSIKIYLENGGLDLIKVIDDGVGMDSDDICMAFMPHATSKIKTEYDLFRINTLGFRGEAIASIASVSLMQIISSQNGTSGYQCTYKSGVKENEGVIQSNKGTTVSVSNLFFNTPARLKYMKSAKSELASVMFYLDRIAMAHPNLRFTVYSDNKMIFQTSGSKSYKTLIGEVYGVEAAKNTLEHSYVADGYKAKLVLVKPSIYRSNKLEITLICNGRFVKNFNVTNAVIEGYSTYVPIGKYPIAVLYFDIDPLLVDVNVHPSKTEIKISDEELLVERLAIEVRKCLEDANHIIQREIEKPIFDKFQKLSIFDESFDEEIASKPIILEENKPSYNERPLALNKPIDVDEPKPIAKEARKLPYMEYVGSVFGTYLIFQNDDGMYLMDQHAAAERVNYEKIYELLNNPNQPTTSLLVPVMLSFTKQEALYVEENLSKFLEIGFALDQVGTSDYAVREIPLWAKDNSDAIIYDIISMMIQNKKIDIMYFRDSIAKQISCKASIKANHRINNDEIQALLENLNKCSNPYTCPHGRPTIIKLSLNDIEKMFERIQS